MKNLRSMTTYYLAEGKANLEESIRLSFNRAVQTGVEKILIFTVNGEGLEIACRNYLSEARFKKIRVIGISFPYGSVPSAALEVPEERQKLLQEFEVPLLRGSSPIDDGPLPGNRPHNLVRKTLEIFSGGTALCVWGILVACDTGFVPAGEHVISCCADTAIVAKASTSAHLLSSFAIREIVCKPLVHDLSKGESLAEELNVEALLKTKQKKSAPRQLPQRTEAERPE
jgi:hypothetical protein